MTHAITLWLRRIYWRVEDGITDVLDFEPHPTPLPPAPEKQAPRRYADCHMIGVSGQMIELRF